MSDDNSNSDGGLLSFQKGKNDSEIIVTLDTGRKLGEGAPEGKIIVQELLWYLLYATIQSSLAMGAKREALHELIDEINVDASQYMPQFGVKA